MCMHVTLLYSRNYHHHCKSTILQFFFKNCLMWLDSATFTSSQISDSCYFKVSTSGKVSTTPTGRMKAEECGLNSALVFVSGAERSLQRVPSDLTSVTLLLYHVPFVRSSAMQLPQWLRW